MNYKTKKLLEKLKSEFVTRVGDYPERETTTELMSAYRYQRDLWWCVYNGYRWTFNKGLAKRASTQVAIIISALVSVCAADALDVKSTSVNAMLSDVTTVVHSFNPDPYWRGTILAISEWRFDTDLAIDSYYHRYLCIWAAMYRLVHTLPSYAYRDVANSLGDTLDVFNDFYKFVEEEYADVL